MLHIHSHRTMCARVCVSVHQTNHRCSLFVIQYQLAVNISTFYFNFKFGNIFYFFHTRNFLFFIKTNKREKKKKCNNQTKHRMDSSILVRLRSGNRRQTIYQLTTSTFSDRRFEHFPKLLRPKPFPKCKINI